MASLSLCYSARPKLHLCSFSRPKFFAMAAMSEDPIREWILTEGKASQITKITSVGGGCINLATHYHTDSASFFVKDKQCLFLDNIQSQALNV